MACGIFPTHGSNPCLLHWQAYSLPLSHQGNPAWLFFRRFSSFPGVDNTQIGMSFFFFSLKFWKLILKIFFSIFIAFMEEKIFRCTSSLIPELLSSSMFSMLDNNHTFHNLKHIQLPCHCFACLKSKWWSAGSSAQSHKAKIKMSSTVGFSSRAYGPLTSLILTGLNPFYL